MFADSYRESDLERNRSKLKILHHAATCPCEDLRCGPNLCTEVVHCCAAKRLFQHILTCTQQDCDVPGCRHSRSVWKHYRRCRATSTGSCEVCSVVPHVYTPKALCRRFRTPASTAAVTTNATAAPTATTGVGDDHASSASASGGTVAAVSKEQVWQRRILLASVPSSPSPDTTAASSSSVVALYDYEKENDDVDGRAWGGSTVPTTALVPGNFDFSFPPPPDGVGQQQQQQQQQQQHTKQQPPTPPQLQRHRQRQYGVRGTPSTPESANSSTGTPRKDGSDASTVTTSGRDPSKKVPSWPDLPAHPRDAPRLHRPRRSYNRFFS